MKSKTISIHSSGNGFIDANQETEQMTAGLPAEQSLQLCLITEEMISLFRSITGEVDNAEFWLENEEGKFTFHLNVHQKLGNIQYNQLIQSTTSKENEAAKGCLGKLREVFVQSGVYGEPPVMKTVDDRLTAKIARKLEGKGFSKGDIFRVLDSIRREAAEYGDE